MSATIVKPIQKAYLQIKEGDKIEDITAVEISQNLKMMIAKYSNKKDDALDDLLQQTFFELLRSFNNNQTFWDSALILEAKQDKQIISYVYAIIRTAFRKLYDKFAEKEKANFYKQINAALKELSENDFLETKGNKIIHKSTKDKPCAYSGDYENIYDFYNIYDDKNSINARKLKSVIKTIFNKYLKNCSILRSHLKKILTHLTNTGNMIEIYESGEEFYRDETIPFWDEVSKKKEEYGTETTAALRDMANAKLAKAKRTLGEDTFDVYGKLFLLKFVEQMTLKQLSEKFNIGKSSVENYINRFRSAAGLGDTFSEDIEEKEKALFLNIFIETLITTLDLELE